MNQYKALYKKWIVNTNQARFFEWERCWVIDTVVVTQGNNDSPYLAACCVVVDMRGNQYLIPVENVRSCDENHIIENGKYWGEEVLPESKRWEALDEDHVTE